MICSNCLHENPEGSKFCNNCGRPLALICSNCGRENPPGSRFCNNCGHPLEGPTNLDNLATPERQVTRRDLMPTDYASKLEAARTNRTMVGERRIVTMLFCDIQGSTAAAQHLDPEEWALIINEAFEHMISPIYHYEGTVARLMGDALLAFFGAPVAHEDDPQRAVLAGLEIVQGMHPFKEKVARDWDIEIDVRVGINTGLVMVGQVGSDLEMEYSALGDAINVAARMEQTAQSGTVQISAATYQMVASAFEFEDLGQLMVKGKIEPLHTYRPLKPKIHALQIRGPMGLELPIVGREVETNILRQALTHLAENSRGGIICLIGEAGLGKSRLLSEVAKTLPQIANGSRLPRWYESAALSYESARPYALFKRLFRRLWSIEPGDPPAAVREKIELALPDEPEQRELFRVLMGVGSPSETEIHEGESFKMELFETVSQFLKSAAITNPLVLVMDDLNWADPASVELFTGLIPLVESAPILFICALRPDQEAPGWKILEIAKDVTPKYFQELDLQALTAEDTRTMVRQIVDSQDLPPSVFQHIIDKTDGNPLYVKEVMRTLIDEEIIVAGSSPAGPHWQAAQGLEDLNIPSNLQTLLIARIDRLQENARETLQLASVIGRSFYFRILAAIHQSATQTIADLDRELDTLQQKEFISQAAIIPEREYIFRHALTQEAAYSTILRRQRRQYHRQVGEAIETLFAGQLEDFFPLLAHHFGRAQDPRTVHYAIKAGDSAFRIYAIAEALSHYSLALSELKREHEGGQNFPGTWSLSDLELLTTIYTRRGRCLELQSAHQASLQNYAEMETIARDQDNQEMLLVALLSQAKVLAIPTPIQDQAAGKEKAHEALQIAQRLQDQESEAKIQWVCMLLEMYSGDMAGGTPYGEKAVVLARQMGMQDLLANSLEDLGVTYFAVGRLDEALAVLEEAKLIYKMVNNLPMLVETLSHISNIQTMKGNFDPALANFYESYETAEKIRNEWSKANALIIVNLIYSGRGQIDQALAKIQEQITMSEKLGHPSRTLGWFFLGRLYTNLGAFNLADQAAESGLVSSEHFPPFHGLSLVMLVRQKLRQGDIAAARDTFQLADQKGLRVTLQLIDMQIDLTEAEVNLALAEYDHALQVLLKLQEKFIESGALYFYPETLSLIAQVLVNQGKETEAHNALVKARQIAENLEDKTVLWQILASLGEKAAAQKVVDTLSENISDSDLRRTFLEYAQSKLLP